MPGDLRQRGEQKIPTEAYKLRRLISLGTLVLGVAPFADDLAAQGPDSLPRDTVDLPEVVITATRGERTERAATPIAISISSPRTADRGASRVTADLFRDITGVYVQQTSAGQGAVILRGFIGNQVLLLVNGIPMNNGTYRDGPGQYLATIDPDAVERIEVIRGPASVLYGSDAQGGVVNVITRPHTAAAGWTVRGTVQASSANSGGRARMSLGYGSDRVSFGLGGSLLHAGDLRAGGDVGAQRPTGFTGEGIDGRLTYRPTGAHTLTVGLEHFGLRDVPRYDRYVDFRAPALGRDAEHVFDPQIRQLAFARHRFRAQTSALWTLQTTASLAIQREGRTRQRLDGNGNPRSTIERTRDDVYTPGLSVVGTSLPHVGARAVMLTWGAEAYRDYLSSHGDLTSLTQGSTTPLTRDTPDGPIATGRFPDGARMDRLGVFLAAESQVIPRLIVSAGARWSRFDSEANVGSLFGGAVENSSSALTGQLGVVITLPRDMRLAFRVAQGFRAPNLYDLTNVGSVPGGIVVPNPDATSEESVSYEASVRWADEMTTFEVTGYRTDVDGFIDRAFGTFNGDTLFNGERVFQGLNIATARLTGVEGEAVHSFGIVAVRLTLLLTHGEQTLADGTEGPMAKIPPLRGLASFRWQPADPRFWVAYDFDWAARQGRLAQRDVVDPRIPSGGTPGYIVHSITANAALTPSFTATLGIENITDKLYRQHASGVDAPGRHLWVGVTLFDGL